MHTREEVDEAELFLIWFNLAILFWATIILLDMTFRVM